jgi:hypothetical protein
LAAFGLLVATPVGHAPVAIPSIVMGALFGTVAGLTVCLLKMRAAR